MGQGSLLPIEKTPCAGDYAPGIVLVGLRKGAAVSEEWTESEIITSIPELDVATLRVPVGRECAELERLRHDPRVAFAELDYAVHAVETRVLIPNDPGWDNQWGPAKIDAPAAWAVTTGTPDVVIAVVDTGVQLDHEDLVDNLWSNPGEIPDNSLDDDGNGRADDVWGWHFYHQWDGETYVAGEDNNVADDHGHGTHVTGVAGARTDNGVGIAGMAGGARLMTVKVLDQDGDGWYSDLAQGIVYAVDNGAQVINLSLGGSLSSQVLEAAVAHAHERGALMVAAAGNTGGEVLYPAACEHVLAVAATERDDATWSDSSHGPQLTVAAPGRGIYSTGWAGDRITNCAAGYCYKTGTSVATPHVSGLAALVWSAHPDRALAQVTRVITTTAMDVNGDLLPGRDERLGWGRIEAGRALSATIQAGELRLTASRPRLRVGEETTITATVPITAGIGSSLTFATGSGSVSPTTSIPVAGVATTTLTADTATGVTVVTAATETLTGSVSIRLLPGSVTSATLTPASWVVASGDSTVVTLRASDSFGNLPLDGIPIEWSADGGTMDPGRSPFDEGTGQAAFTAGSIHGLAVITAGVASEALASIIVDVVPPVEHCYLPLILHPGGR